MSKIDFEIVPHFYFQAKKARKKCLAGDILDTKKASMTIKTRS